MDVHALLFCILFPLFSGAFTFALRGKSRKIIHIYTMCCVLVNSIFTAFLLFSHAAEGFSFLRITDEIELVFRIDGLGTVFAALVAFLWPLATLYAFEYMKHESNETMFFAFYTMTYGITLGLAFSGNALTMYLFFEFLTLITTPLVFHTQTREAVKAARKYLYYSISGAAIGFVAVIFVLIYGRSTDFAYGGILALGGGNYDEGVLRFAYVLSFVGFGVKAAVFPLHGWLPSASVAPTPVTALLHAVAVVKAGAFVIMRMTYYVFGTELLRGSWAQTVVTLLAAITIVYGSSMAVKEHHLKRRLAYSTISNLSYILIGITLMSPLGFLGALTHMVFHAVMKISSFFCAGAIMLRSGKHNIEDLEGMGKQMPFTFTCFTVAALSLVGMPPFIGFISKYNLVTAAVESGTWLSYLSVGVLFFSALLVGVYMLTIVIRAFFPREGIAAPKTADPGWEMKLPIAIFTVLIIVMGVNSTPIVTYLSGVANGLF